MYISCIQMNPQSDLNNNLSTAMNLILEAVKAGAEVVVLPEMFTYMGEESYRKSTKNKIGEGVFAKFQNIARELNIVLVAGSHSEEIINNPNKVYNTCITFNNKGEIISKYRKYHLFNLRDQHGKSLYCESDSFEFGDLPSSYFIGIKNEKWKALNIICYDLRFPEIIRQKEKENYFDIIIVPAAFTWQTGKDHWEVLLRARAIENQCYIVACNQTGFFCNGQKKNFGNSMIIDPWGNIVAKLGEEVGILNAEINKGAIEDVRNKLPALVDRRIF